LGILKFFDTLVSAGEVYNNYNNGQVQINFSEDYLKILQENLNVTRDQIEIARQQANIALENAAIAKDQTSILREQANIAQENTAISRQQVELHTKNSYLAGQDMLRGYEKDIGELEAAKIQYGLDIRDAQTQITNYDLWLDNYSSQYAQEVAAMQVQTDELKASGKEAYQNFLQAIGYSDALAGATGRVGANTSQAKITGMLDRQLTDYVGEDRTLDENGGLYASQLTAANLSMEQLKKDLEFQRTEMSLNRENLVTAIADYEEAIGLADKNIKESKEAKDELEKFVDDNFGTPEEPVIPEPVIPEPVIPEPVIPEPVIPEPVTPKPIVLSPASIAAQGTLEKPFAYTPSGFKKVGFFDPIFIEEDPEPEPEPEPEQKPKSKSKLESPGIGSLGGGTIIGTKGFL
jgi:hypothetical protein